MNLKTQFALGFLLLSATSLLFTANAAEGTIGDNDALTFRGKIVYVVAKTIDPRSGAGSGLYEKGEVKRLGDRFFFVGVIAVQGESPIEKSQQGKRVWTPVSDIVQISEFDSMDDVRQFFGAAKTLPRADR